MPKKRPEGTSQALARAVELVQRHRADIVEEIARLTEEGEKLDEMLNQLGIERPKRRRERATSMAVTTKPKSKKKRAWSEEQRRRQSEMMKSWWAAQAKRKKS